MAIAWEVLKKEDSGTADRFDVGKFEVQVGCDLISNLRLTARPLQEL